jgi:hypothetical protein
MPLLVVVLHLMVTRTIATMVTVISLAAIGTSTRTIAVMAVMMDIAVTRNAMMMVGGITVMMERGTAGMTVVLPRVAVVGPPPLMLTPSARFARSMATRRISAGGATLTVTVVMMMTLALVRRAPMGLTPTGTWTTVLLII